MILLLGGALESKQDASLPSIVVVWLAVTGPLPLRRGVALLSESRTARQCIFVDVLVAVISVVALRRRFLWATGVGAGRNSSRKHLRQ